MQPIPYPVKNVTIREYNEPSDIADVVVLSGASGTYAVGTLTTNIFYNLDIRNEGKKKGKLNIHSRYSASWENESGQLFTTPWMYCLDNSDKPQFGRTISLGAGNELGSEVAQPSEFIQLGPLTDITVSQFFENRLLVGYRILVTEGTGNIIATRIGTPHLMGIQVDTGKGLENVKTGMKPITISGRTKDGHLFSQTGYTTIRGGKPSIFLREF